MLSLSTTQPLQTTRHPALPHSASLDCKEQHHLVSELIRKFTHGEKTLVGGNWKCNGTKESVNALVQTLNGGGRSQQTPMSFAHPLQHLDYVQSNLRSDYEVCVQNIWTADGPGAYTGELVASMVKDFGVNWTLVGHSERRYKVAAETNGCSWRKRRRY